MWPQYFIHVYLKKNVLNAISLARGDKNKLSRHSAVFPFEERRLNLVRLGEVWVGDPTAGGGDFHKHSCTSLKQMFLNVYGSTRTNLSECRAVVGCSKLFRRFQPQ